MRILILGSLGANQDRALDLLDQGHQVVYAYTQPSGEIPTLTHALDCIAVTPGKVASLVDELVARHRCEIVYSLVSSYDGSLECLAELLESRPSIGIVRHYKEHGAIPNDLERTSLRETDGQIYANRESLAWFAELYGVRQDTAHILDPDLISARYLAGDFSPKLRDSDGAPHIVVAGSVSALEDRYDVRELCIEMSRRGVFIHLYASFLGPDPGGYGRVEDAATQALYAAIAQQHDRVRLHDMIFRSKIVSCWSRYDAGFLHAPVGPGDPSPQYERLNTAHRYSAYLAAGLPILSPIGGHDAMESFILEQEVGFLYDDYDVLAEWLWDSAAVERVASIVRRSRQAYTFGAEVPRLVAILRRYTR